MTIDPMRSGYVPCACRDCFEIAIGRRGVAMCWQCQEADCPGGETECQAPCAYGELEESEEQ